MRKESACQSIRQCDIGRNVIICAKLENDNNLASYRTQHTHTRTPNGWQCGCALFYGDGRHSHQRNNIYRSHQLASRHSPASERETKFIEFRLKACVCSLPLVTQLHSIKGTKPFCPNRNYLIINKKHTRSTRWSCALISKSSSDVVNA